jgi:uncharacterized protein (DUF433 family)
VEGGAQGIPKPAARRSHEHERVADGAWVLRGTRMPVSVIFENLEAGANMDDILDWFEGLDREQIRAVIEFAARSLDEAPAASTP